MLTYDRNTLALVQENTYSLDYTTWQGSLNAAAPWSLRFSQNQGLNLADLSVTNLMDAWAAMAGFGSQGAQYYNNEYTGGRLPLICTASNWPVYYNAIRWMLPRHFLENARP